MATVLFAIICLIHDPLLNDGLICSSRGNMSHEKNRKRTEMEWICSRCRLPAEGSYCTRCGQVYEKPTK